MADKKIRQQRDVEEGYLYIKQQLEHVKTLNELDAKAAEDRRKRLLDQQAERDRQLKDVRDRQKQEKREQIKADIEHNAKLRREQEEEAKILRVKKEQEKEYLFKML